LRVAHDVATVNRLPVPAFLHDLGEPPGAPRTLLVAALALAAAGLNPQVLSPAVSTVQAAIREQPQINALLLLVTLAAAAMLFVGGGLSDTNGRREILLTALGALAVTNILSLVVPTGPVFMASRVAGAAAAYAVLPFALALVATTYAGIARATAIGIAYAAYAGGSAAAPVLLTLLGPTGPWWPAFLVAAIVAGIALWWARPRARDLEAPARTDRDYVVWTGVWAFATVVITAGLVDIGNRIASPVRIGLITLGIALLVADLVWDRRRVRARVRVQHVDRRPVTVAVSVGVVVGFAQAAPLFQLPLFFHVVLGYGVIVATIATAPLILALVVAGPIAGALIQRLGPRILVAGGLAAVGFGNLLVGWLLGRNLVYASLIVPLILIGGGFVIATTVRTAIIFSSVSRGLPGTAAALNEASLLVGSRIGLAALTALVTERALDLYGATLATVDPAARETAISAFRDVLVAAGSPVIGQILGALDPANLAAYGTAFVEATRESLIGTGLVAVVAAPIAWLALGRRDPISTVWDHAEERPETATSAG
jgi:MFS family permease